MRRFIPAGLAVACIAAVLAAAPAATAHSTPVPPPHPGITGRLKALILTVAEGDKALPARAFSLLVCGPPHGTHPAAAQACTQLERAKGDIAAIESQSEPRICTLIYQPVTVTATGLWDGRFVRFERTYGNVCSLKGATGSVFAF